MSALELQKLITKEKSSNREFKRCFSLLSSFLLNED